MNPNEQLMKLQQENSILLINLNKISKKMHELEEKSKKTTETNMVIIAGSLFIHQFFF